jgi:hypothetical protein
MSRATAGLPVHARSLATSTAISRCYVANFIDPLDIVRVLRSAGVSFVLAGAHGLGGWTGKPRATADVDVIVAKRHLKKAVQALSAAFPELEAVDCPVVVRFRPPGTQDTVIDVMKPNQGVIAAALKNTHTVRGGRQSYRIPSLEMALALKFAAMISPYRHVDDKLQDAVDFRRIVNANPNVNAGKLAVLGALVYPDGGRKIVEMVRRVRAGERLEL